MNASSPLSATDTSANDVAESSPGSQHLRADAQRNLTLILDAARSVFARRGLAATLDEVAREAGLGVGTVYRRFRDKNELTAAVFAAELEGLVADAEQAAKLKDPWDGFVTFIARYLERQAEDCGLRDLVGSTLINSEQCMQIKERLWTIAQGIVERAKTAGVLRADFNIYDLPVLVVMLGSAADFSQDAHPELWRRYLSMILDGLRIGTQLTELGADAMSEDQVRESMQCWRPHHRG